MTRPSIALVATLATIGVVHAAEPAATPQRPSVSVNTATVPAAGFEMEAGAEVYDGGAGLPVLLKYGVTRRTEIELGIDLVRSADLGSGTLASFGDVAPRVRARLIERSDVSFAVMGSVKLPTAKDGVGSGHPDIGATAIVSVPLDAFSLDANLWVSALGRGGSSSLGQIQGVVTLNLPASGPWSGFVEVAGQGTAGQGTGTFLDAGVGYAPTRRTVLDAAVGRGWSHGYPDWYATVGWTVLFGGRSSP